MTMNKEQVLSGLIEGLKGENEEVTFINEDVSYFYFSIFNKGEFDFIGTARIEKNDYDTGNYLVDFKEEGQDYYKGDMMIMLED